MRIEKVSWEQARTLIKRHNTRLCDEIDSCVDKTKPYLYHVKYRFGEPILDHGDFVFDNIPDKTLAKQVKKDLAYTPDMPIGIVLNNTMELHCETANQKIIPWRLMEPGTVFGLWEMMQPVGTSSHTGTMWSITAGARSVMLLEKFSEASGIKRLNNSLGIRCKAPRSLFEHFSILEKVANSPEVISHNDWELELIYFPKAWMPIFSKEKDNPVRSYLLNKAWLDTSYLRDQIVFDYAFSRSLTESNLKPNPYLTDTLKHLYAMARSKYPGFRIVNDERVMPFNLLRNVIEEVYRPVFAVNIVCPAALSETQSVYYSTHLDTQLVFSPRSNKSKNQITELRELKHIATVTKEFLLHDKLGLQGTPIYNVLNSVEYGFYHSLPDAREGIHSSKELLEDDEMLKVMFSEPSSKQFCHTSPFFRGAIKLSSNEK